MIAWVRISSASAAESLSYKDRFAIPTYLTRSRLRPLPLISVVSLRAPRLAVSVGSCVAAPMDAASRGPAIAIAARLTLCVVLRCPALHRVVLRCNASSCVAPRCNQPTIADRRHYALYAITHVIFALSNWDQARIALHAHADARAHTRTHTHTHTHTHTGCCCSWHCRLSCSGARRRSCTARSPGSWRTRTSTRSARCSE